MIKSIIKIKKIVNFQFIRQLCSEPAKTILVNKEGPLTLIGINRPEHKNAIDTETSYRLCEAINAFEEDKTSSVGVLYGIGGSFCAGHDINEMLSDTIKPEILTLSEGSVGPTRRFIKKPVVCAINGYCVANGLELALMCDLRVMEDSAVLGFLNRRFGMPLIDGGSVRLPSLIGLSRALDLVLTGRQVVAKEAMEIGLVNRVVATGAALGQAVNLAHCLAKFPQLSLSHDRESLYNAAFDSSNFNEAIQYEIFNTNKEMFQEAVQGCEKFKEGIGRAGKSYNIKERTVPDWEREEILRENEVKNSK